MEPLLIIEIPEYVREFEISKSVRPKYYELNSKKIPKKYCSGGYEFANITIGKKTKRVLINLLTGEPVIANPRSVGKARVRQISGNDLFNEFTPTYVIAKQLNVIKNQMSMYIQGLPPITKLPIRIIMEIHDTFEDETNSKWDVSNRALMYIKAFEDVICGFKKMVKRVNGKEVVNTINPLIPDDNRLYITQPPAPIFFPIEDTKQRKLIFKIYQDVRDCIKTARPYRIFQQI